MQMFESIWKRAQQDRLIIGSPPFEISIADIVASGSMFYGMEHRAEINNFLPMNFIRMMNKGGTTLKIYVNDQVSGEEILDNTIYQRTGEIWSFKLENLSTTTTATGATIFTHVQRKAAGGQ
jgi:hypothetical protein